MSNAIGYIYLTENIVNGKCYIGKRLKPKFNPKYHGSGKVLMKAINKYGKENFITQPIEWVYDRELLGDREKY